ncbi:hypothetical protein ADL01_26375, partial [Streptomyces sp. NRRL WC-3618]|uniref:acyl-CoA dehydrogenase family protein n=1 Tax=Streptomyces sp. NRRL WC-3618 TaxID=1519490 RepID=UPI0006C61ECA
VAHRAFELGVQNAQQRHTFGKAIAQHKAIQFTLAEMDTKVDGAHAMMVKAARKNNSGERNDLGARMGKAASKKDSWERSDRESGRAKYLSSECCKEVVEDASRM